MQNDSAKIAGAFLLGGLVGAFVALLYAPKTGKETRREISKVAKNVKRSTTEFVEDTVDTIHDFVDDVKDRATYIVDKGTDLTDSAKKEIIHSIEYGQKVIEKQKDRIVKALGI